MSFIEEQVASVNDLSDGQMKQVRVGNHDVLLVRQNGEFIALGATCPHYGAPLVEGTLSHGRIYCPWHASVFDAASGDLLEPPSLDALPRFPHRVEGDRVYVSVAEDADDRRVMQMCECNACRDNRRFVIVGRGAAAASAAEELRKSGFQGNIIMIGPEESMPYDRPNCSKGYLSGDVSDEGMPLRKAEFYQENDIDQMLAHVRRLDVLSRKITLHDGESLSADAILVATGGTPRQLEVPGADLPGVMTLRSWADSRSLRQAAETAERAVVIGAGFIGMEVAANLVGRGLDTTVVAPESVPLQKQLGEEAGSLIRKLHDEHGTRFRLGRRVSRILGDRSVEAVELDDSTRLSADVVVVALGIVPVTGFLEEVPINEDQSVDVDSRLQISNGVFAAGDIARYPDPFSDRRIRIEHWRLALQHGRAAARNMTGHSAPFDGVPFFWTRQFGQTLMYAGHADQWDDVLLIGDPADLDCTIYYVRNDRLIAAAGTQDKQITAFMEGMRLGTLPTATELRNRSSAELTV